MFFKHIVEAVKNPTPLNILRAAVPAVPMVEEKVAQVSAAVNQPSLTNIISVADPPAAVGPRPSQVANDVKEIVEAVPDPEKLGKKIVQMGIREAAIVPNREIIYTIVEGLLKDMQRQAENKWKSLPTELITILKNHYAVDLNKVSYAQNISTPQAGSAIAFPLQIFFPRAIDPLNNKQDLHWLLHELTHEDQYLRVGGLHNFLDNYSADVLLKIVTQQSFDVHDHLEYEKEADQRADQLIEDVWVSLGNRSTLRC